MAPCLCLVHKEHAIVQVDSYLLLLRRPTLPFGICGRRSLTGTDLFFKYFGLSLWIEWSPLLQCSWSSVIS